MDRVSRRRARRTEHGTRWQEGDALTKLLATKTTFDAASTTLAKIVTLNRHGADVAKAHAADVYTAARFATIGIMLVSIVLGLALALLLTQSLSNSVSTVVASSQQVAAAAEQIAGGSQHMASGATEQAASIEEASSSVSELASMSEQMAANAKEPAPWRARRAVRPRPVRRAWRSSGRRGDPAQRRQDGNGH